MENSAPSADFPATAAITTTAPANQQQQQQLMLNFEANPESSAGESIFVTAGVGQLVPPDTPQAPQQQQVDLSSSSSQATIVVDGNGQAYVAVDLGNGQRSLVPVDYATVLGNSESGVSENPSGAPVSGGAVIGVSELLNLVSSAGQQLL